VGVRSTVDRRSLGKMLFVVHCTEVKQMLDSKDDDEALHYTDDSLQANVGVSKAFGLLLCASRHLPFLTSK